MFASCSSNSPFFRWLVCLVLIYSNSDGQNPAFCQDTFDPNASDRATMVILAPVANHIDAQPNKMFEYMSAGIPVIASDFPLWREIIEGSDCGLCVNPGDPAAIAGAIDTLVADRPLAERMGRNGKRAVVNVYNWGQEEPKLISLYEELLK